MAPLNYLLSYMIALFPLNCLYKLRYGIPKCTLLEQFHQLPPLEPERSPHIEQSTLAAFCQSFMHVSVCEGFASSSLAVLLLPLYALYKPWRFGSAAIAVPYVASKLEGPIHAFVALKAPAPCTSALAQREAAVPESQRASYRAPCLCYVRMPLHPVYKSLLSTVHPVDSPAAGQLKQCGQLCWFSFCFGMTDHAARRRTCSTSAEGVHLSLMIYGSPAPSLLKLWPSIIVND